MPFVKLDCGMLNSTLWFERLAREIFITALLMAEPFELKEKEKQIEIRSLEETGWEVPPGRYGFVSAAGVGIIRRAMIPNEEVEAALNALSMLGSAETASRSQEFEGRRLVRIDGGFIVLNYDKYRERDYTAAARQARYRRNKRNAVTATCHGVTSRPVTQAEAEADKETRVLGALNGISDDSLWIELQNILPPLELQKNTGLWLSRIKESRHALYEAICDFKYKRNKRLIRNVPAWITQRYQHFKSRRSPMKSCAS